MKRKSLFFDSSLERLIAILFGIALVNVGLLYMLRMQANGIRLLQQQKKQLEQDQAIINSSEQIYATYKDHIEDLLAVFPSEEDVLMFLETLQDIAKKHGSNASARFSSPSPQQEGDKLFLLFRVTMTTDKDGLKSFLQEAEQLPYMTRLLTLSMGLSDGIQGDMNVTLLIKLYVKNPFTS